MTHRRSVSCTVSFLTIIAELLLVSSAAYGGDITLPLQIPVSEEKQIRICILDQCQGIATYAKLLYQFLVGFAGILAVLALTWGGVRWLLSGGESSKIQEAQKIIGNALIGLLLMLGSYLILRTLGKEFIEFPPIRVGRIEEIDIGFPRDLEKLCNGFQHPAMIHWKKVKKEFKEIKPKKPATQEEALAIAKQFAPDPDIKKLLSDILRLKGTASTTEAEQNNNLANLIVNFGLLETCDDTIQSLRGRLMHIVGELRFSLLNPYVSEQQTFGVAATDGLGWVRAVYNEIYGKQELKTFSSRATKTGLAYELFYESGSSPAQVAKFWEQWGFYCTYRGSADDALLFSATNNKSSFSPVSMKTSGSSEINHIGVRMDEYIYHLSNGTVRKDKVVNGKLEGVPDVSIVGFSCPARGKDEHIIIHSGGKRIRR